MEWKNERVQAWRSAGEQFTYIWEKQWHFGSAHAILDGERRGSVC